MAASNIEHLLHPNSDLPEHHSSTSSTRLNEFREVTDLPLKKASILSVRALEDGPATGPIKKHSLWARLLMSLRRRQTGSQYSYHECAQDDITTIKSEKSSANLKFWRSFVIQSLISILAAFGLIHLINVFFSLGPVLLDTTVDTSIRTWNSFVRAGAPLSDYPTNITRDVLPIPCHSHNDYWRRVPLLEALHYGCTGVEADVWFFDGELYVGHSTSDLRPEKTLETLYINPLLHILGEKNAPTLFANNTSNGVFDRDPTQTLVFLVDFKNSGRAIWPVVQQQLESLRSRGYLTHFNGQAVIHRPITVVATGNAPFDLLVSNPSYRDIFFDAPLASLWEEPSSHVLIESAPHIGSHNPALEISTPILPPSTDGEGEDQGPTGLPTTITPDIFTAANSYYASASFKKAIGRLCPFARQLSEKHLRLIRGQIQGAKRKGLKARYWGTPGWPIALRNHVWEALVREGADYLNVDDLSAAATRDWTGRAHRVWF
ncbi:hypothetical protein M501DRAFT_1021086 [Patellaria atrata CBS 101060]|uniref:Altered inheritance of mitochondria protein 6 n=1 Tax=Patellaria atrata CBS 101060 TaxID=1346257 RepID=A0A9P4S0Q2_9PEZI|nr:hypothetical protein M501DRAFT_1021086 [Patellaria atrata CBS 101060]